MVFAACIGMRATELRMLAHLLMLGQASGRPVPIRVSLAELVTLGAASSKTKALGALRSLERMGVIVRSDVITVVPVDDWPHDLDQLQAQWAAATRGSVWGTATPLVDAARTMFDLVPDELLSGPRPTWHPSDRRSIEWVASLVRLFERHGGAVFGALAAAGRDPQMLAPFTARAFRRDVWALIIRSRRYFPELAA